MEINALLMDEKDNVVTCVTEVAAGQDVVYRKGQEFCTVKAEENIPYCHKVALVDLKKGDEVIKYGESLGGTGIRRNRRCNSGVINAKKAVQVSETMS